MQESTGATRSCSNVPCTTSLQALLDLGGHVTAEHVTLCQECKLCLFLLCVYPAGWTPSSGWELERRNCSKRTCMQCLTTANQKHYNKNLRSE